MAAQALPEFPERRIRVTRGMSNSERLTTQHKFTKGILEALKTSDGTKKAYDGTSSDYRRWYRAILHEANGLEYKSLDYFVTHPGSSRLTEEQWDEIILAKDRHLLYRAVIGTLTDQEQENAARQDENGVLLVRYYWSLWGSPSLSNSVTAFKETANANAKMMRRRSSSRDSVSFAAILIILPVPALIARRSQSKEENRKLQRPADHRRLTPLQSDSRKTQMVILTALPEHEDQQEQTLGARCCNSGAIPRRSERRCGWSGLVPDHSDRLAHSGFPGARFWVWGPLPIDEWFPHGDLGIWRSPMESPRGGRTSMG